MKLILLPGFSQKNKEAVDELENDLKNDFSVEKIYWNHWSTNSEKLDTAAELVKLRDLIGEDDTYLAAKSIGTWLTMKILPEKSQHIKKLILCGIPLTGLIKDGNTPDYLALKDYPANQVKVFQNENDPWGTHTQVKEFIRGINPLIEVQSMPRTDHSYPYSQEFAKFLL